MYGCHYLIQKSMIFNDALIVTVNKMTIELTFEI